MTGRAMAARSRRAKIAIWLSVASGLALVVLANAHLVYLALASQPSCVAPSQRADGSFRAAEWVCSGTDGDDRLRGRRP